jgi:hypothetical protein
MVWFSCSVALAVIENAVFVAWLRRRGARLTWIWSGHPGYVERAYAEWCQRTGRSPTQVVWIRRLILLNMIAAIVASIPLLSQSRYPSERPFGSGVTEHPRKA